VIVAEDENNATERRNTGQIGMLDGIAGSIDAGTLAVPKAEHALDVRTRQQADLLRARHGGEGEIFIQTRHEANIFALQLRPYLPQFGVEAAEWRASIAANEARGIEPGGAIEGALQKQQPH